MPPHLCTFLVLFAQLNFLVEIKYRFSSHFDGGYYIAITLFFFFTHPQNRKENTFSCDHYFFFNLRLLPVRKYTYLHHRDFQDINYLVFFKYNMIKHFL